MSSETAANMFSKQPSTSVPVGDKKGEPSSSSTGFTDSTPGFSRKAAAPAAKLPGRRPRGGVDPRLMPGVDVRRGMANLAKGELVEESVMSKEAAGLATKRMLDAWGIYSGEDEGIIMGVMDQLWFSCAINGTSVAQAGRAQIKVAGQVFEVKLVVELLGEDYRRWARANADQIRASCERVIRDFDPNDFVASDRYTSLMRVAYTRGMQRLPHLAFDVADYCTGLTMPEVMAIAQSKVVVLSNVTNTPDALLATGRAQTVDGFQSGFGSEAHGDVGGTQASARRG